MATNKNTTRTAKTTARTTRDHKTGIPTSEYAAECIADHRSLIARYEAAAESDKAKAFNVRHAFERLHFYRTCDIANNPDWTFGAANARLMLKQYADLLNANDVMALLEAARVLCDAPLDPTMFERIRENGKVSDSMVREIKREQRSKCKAGAK